jgi:hypothetical protein
MDAVIPSAQAGEDIRAEDRKAGVGTGKFNAKKALGGPDEAPPPAEKAGYKTGSDDARVTGKSTKEKDETFIAMWMRNTRSTRKEAEAELKRKKAEIERAKKGGR